MPSIPWRTVATPQPAQDYLVLASLLPLRTYRTIPWFLGLTLSVVRQLEQTEGLSGYSLLAQPLKRTFWTLSAWNGQAELAAFVATVPHSSVMTRLRPHMGRTRFATWTVPGSALPIPWPSAIDRLTGSTTETGEASP
jgi:hypothetical protein